MNFLTIKHITIKSLVTLANFLAIVALLIIFLTYIEKIKNISLATIFKVAYILLAFAIAIFIFYHVVRAMQIKKSSFQLLKRHKVYIYSFYYVEYFCFLLNLMIIILVNTKLLVNTNATIVFAVFLSVIFIATMIVSVLESIVRVEERIFINQQQMNNTDNSNKTDFDNQDNKIQTIEAEINPFLALEENNEQNDEEENHENKQ